MKKRLFAFVMLLFCSTASATIVPLYDPTAIHQDGSNPLTADWNAGNYTIQAEQLTSTDDITMLGHILTLGDSSTTDPSILFTGNSHNAIILFDESADEFLFGTVDINLAGDLSLEALLYSVKVENPGIMKIYNSGTDTIIDGDPTGLDNRTLILQTGDKVHMKMGVGSTGGNIHDMDIGTALGTYYAHGTWNFDGGSVSGIDTLTADTLTDGTFSVTGGAITGATNTNWDTAYTHSQDNTQAHSDYLINDGNDSTSGALTAAKYALAIGSELEDDGGGWTQLSGDGVADGGFAIALPQVATNGFYYGYGGTEHHYFGTNGTELEIKDDGALNIAGIITSQNWINSHLGFNVVDGKGFGMPAKAEMLIYYGPPGYLVFRANGVERFRIASTLATFAVPIQLGGDIDGQSSYDLNNMVHGTFSGTVQAEQLTSTDDITMQGHLLTLGDDSATDIVMSFKGSANDATITFDESNNEFEFGSSKVTTSGYGLFGVLYIGNGTAAAPSYAWTNATDAGMYFSESPDKVGIAFGGSDRIAMVGDDIAFGNASTDTITHTGRMIVREVTDNAMDATAGSTREIVFNTDDSKFYGCTAGGNPATWVAFN